LKPGRALRCAAACAVLATMLGAVPARAATTVPFQLVNDHVFIDIALNGTGPYHFVFDSGAPFDLLDTDVARELGLHVKPHGTVGGVGAAEAPAGEATVRVVRVGDLALAAEPFVVTDLHATIGAAEGRAIDGVIGRDVLERFPTTFDYESGSIVLGADVRALVRAGATLVPMRLAGGIPQIACRIATIPAACNVDTGSRLAVTVPAPFVAAHPEAAPSGRSAVGIDGFGLGGPAFGRLGRLRTLAFGGFSLHDVVCDYSTQTRGAFANPALGANIGGGIWRRFTLTFDYAHRRLALRANSRFDRPEPPDRSGLFLIGRDDAVRVLDVRADTPAAHAGIAKNDRIVAVDRRRVAASDLPSIRARLMSAPETIVTLTVEDDGWKRDVALTLDDFV